MASYIFVTGGVVSGLGKGIAAASLGALLSDKGYRVSLQKLDPYLNIDAGTMNPYQHGEVFVTEDGAETDLDLGHYERFLDENTNILSNVTTGQIYKSVLERERDGSFQGDTIQIVPHVTKEIQNKILSLQSKTDADIIICEIGGTVGDLESAPFLEAIRQMPMIVGKENCCYIHLTYVPFLAHSGEIKTKPTQHSVRDLRNLGISADIIICRTAAEVILSEDIKNKISMFCGIEEKNVIQAKDCKTIYEVPLNLIGLDKSVLEILGWPKTASVKSGIYSSIQISQSGWTWTGYKMYFDKPPEKEVTIGIAGKYVSCQDAYKSIDESLVHAGKRCDVKVNVVKIDTEKDSDLLGKIHDGDYFGLDGIIVPGGFGGRGVKGKLTIARSCIKNNFPYLGICYGMHVLVIEFAKMAIKGSRHGEINTVELDSECKYPVISLMENQKNVSFGGTMRLGSYDCDLIEGTLTKDLYNRKDEEDSNERKEIVTISERHRHRYEVNSEFIPNLEEIGVKISGINKKSGLVEIVEYPKNDFCIACQFHPEFKSRPINPHPLFVGLVESAIARKYKNDS